MKITIEPCVPGNYDKLHIRLDITEDYHISKVVDNNAGAFKDNNFFAGLPRAIERMRVEHKAKRYDLIDRIGKRLSDYSLSERLKDMDIETLITINKEIGRIQYSCTPTTVRDIINILDRYGVDTRPRFSWDAFFNHEIGIKLSSDRDRMILLSYLHGKGITWISGYSLIDSAMDDTWSTHITVLYARKIQGECPLDMRTGIGITYAENTNGDTPIVDFDIEFLSI